MKITMRDICAFCLGALMVAGIALVQKKNMLDRSSGWFARGFIGCRDGKLVISNITFGNFKVPEGKHIINGDAIICEAKE